jgi:glycosyltransferase involved in cell wall biosynthesis
MEHHKGPTRNADDARAGALTLLVAIPAFNEADTIGEVVERVREIRIPEAGTPIVVVIDDGSTDATREHASAAGAEVVSHGHNLGIAEAFRTAVRVCLEHGADIAVTMDADLQFAASDIPALVQPILDDRADFVAGDRFHEGRRPENMPLVKYRGNLAMTRVVNWVTRSRFRDVSSGYRAYSREALLNLNVQSSFTYTQESFIELAAKGLRIEQIPVDVKYYAGRRSRVSARIAHYTLRTLLTIMRTVRDYAPLTVFGTVAAVALIPGLLLALFVAAHYVATGSFSPYIFVAFAAAYLLMAGFGVLVVGLMADMLRGIRANQERLLYYSKRAEFGAARPKRNR